MRTAPHSLVLSLLLLGIAACDAGQAPPSGPPSIAVGEQYLIDGTIVARAVTAPRAGFLVLRLDDGHHAPRADDVLGLAPLEEGTNRNVRVPVHWVIDDVEKLWAVLHEDAGTPGTFDPATDPPVMHEGRPVQRFFFAFEGGARIESRIVIEDQHVTDGVVYVDEVLVGEPGWLVIHRDNGGRPRVPGIIAIEPVEPGLNYDVALPLFAEEKIVCGERLWPMLHVRNVSNEQPYNMDRPIVTVPVINACP